MRISNYKNQITVIIAVILISTGLVISSVILGNTNFYIKNLGNSLEQNGKIVNSISVSGDGKIFAKADMAQIEISISEIAPTSEEALKNANQKITQVISTLKSRGLDSNDIKTSQFNIYPEYNYNNEIKNLKGQRATIALNIKIKKLDDQASKATLIIDEISKIENIQINSITFDIEDKTPYFTKARELAMSKAKQKATELSNLAGVKLLSPVSIIDTNYDITPPKIYNQSNVKNLAMPTNNNSGVQDNTSIQSGQLEISAGLSVVYAII